MSIERNLGNGGGSRLKVAGAFLSRSKQLIASIVQKPPLWMSVTLVGLLLLLSEDHIRLYSPIGHLTSWNVLLVILHYKTLIIGAIVTLLASFISWQTHKGARRWILPLFAVVVTAVLWLSIGRVLEPGRFAMRQSPPYAMSIDWGVVAATLIVISALILLWKLPRWQVVRAGRELSASNVLELVNEYRRTLAQILGGTLLLVGLYATWEQVAIAARGATLEERRFITERIEKCTEKLADQRPAIVTGAIAELVSLQSSSQDVGCRIQAILEGYIRSARAMSNAPTPPPIGDPESGADGVELALRQLRRLPYCPRLNLSNLDLRNLSLESTDLSGVIFSNSYLDGAILVEADLTGAQLEGATLVGTDLSRASLAGATGLAADQLRQAITVNTLLPSGNSVR